MNPNPRKKLIMLFLAGMFTLLALPLFHFFAKGDPAADASGAGTGRTLSGKLEEPKPGHPGSALPFEETLSPFLADEVNQIDYALAQAMSRLSLPLDDIKVDGDFLLKEEENGQLYHIKFIRLYVGGNVPLFVKTLRDAMLAWAEKAVLAEGRADQTLTDAEGETSLWDVYVDGVKTHSLLVIGGKPKPAPPDGGEKPEKIAAPAPPPQNADPLLVIVMDDLGESMRQADALLSLDFPVTFAVWPRSTRSGAIAAAAHAKGREVIVHQPMEPVGYPQVNTGQGVLLLGMNTGELREILEKNISLVPYATGLNNHMGSALTQNERAMRAVSGLLAEREFLVLDSLTHARSSFSRVAAGQGVRALRRDVFLDVVQEKSAVIGQLRRAERIAALKGQAVAIGHPYPETMRALKEWQSLRDPGIRIVSLKDLQSLKAR